MPANTILIKEVNKELVRNELKRMRKATIHQLSLATGLSVVTVGALLAEMAESGEAFESATVPSNGGRPSALYSYNENFRLAAVIYGYQKNDSNLIRFLVVNLYGECIEKQEVYSRDVEVQSFAPTIDDFLAKYPAIGAIGFGLPGSEENGVILTHDYRGLIGEAFMRFYRSRYGLPVVFINDVNAAVAGYYSSCGKSKCIAGLYFPRIYLPGAGMVINGGIHRGFRSFAGELGGMPLGTDWINLDYSDADAVTREVGRLVAAYCCILAPEKFVLYGDFFNEDSAERIRGFTRGLLPRHFEADLCVSGDFEKDFERGAILTSLEELNAPAAAWKGG